MGTLDPDLPPRIKNVVKRLARDSHKFKTMEISGDYRVIIYPLNTLLLTFEYRIKTSGNIEYMYVSIAGQENEIDETVAELSPFEPRRVRCRYDQSSDHYNVGVMFYNEEYGVDDWCDFSRNILSDIKGNSLIDVEELF